MKHLNEFEDLSDLTKDVFSIRNDYCWIARPMESLAVNLGDNLTVDKVLELIGRIGHVYDVYQTNEPFNKISYSILVYFSLDGLELKDIWEDAQWDIALPNGSGSQRPVTEITLGNIIPLTPGLPNLGLTVEADLYPIRVFIRLEPYKFDLDGQIKDDVEKIRSIRNKHFNKTN